MEIGVRKRARVGKACRGCRLRKTKCDGRCPCATCQSHDDECVFGSAQDFSHEKDATPVLERRSNATAVVRRASGQPSLQGSDAPHVSCVLPAENYAGQIASADNDRGYPLGFSAPAFHRAVAKALDEPRDMSESSPIRDARESQTHWRTGSMIGWNCGIREGALEYGRPPLSEQYSNHFKSHEPQRGLLDLLTEDDALNLAMRYLGAIEPVLSILGPFEHWRPLYICGIVGGTSPERTALTATAALVAAVGSLFGHDSFRAPFHPAERSLVHRAASMLRDENERGPPTVQHAQAWALYSLYLRATSPPHNALCASDAALRVCESMFIEHSAEEQHLLRGRNACRASYLLNRMSAFETGRSSFALGNRAFQTFVTGTDDKTLLGTLLTIAHTLSKTSEDIIEERHIAQILKMADSIPPGVLSESDDLLRLATVDSLLFAYRTIRLQRSVVPPSLQEQLIVVGDPACESILRIICIRRQPWWQAIGLPFQLICTYLAMDTPQSLAAVPTVVDALRQLHHALQSKASKEAYSTAQGLIRLSARSKEKSAELLYEAASSSFSTKKDRGAQLSPYGEGGAKLASPLVDEHNSQLVDLDTILSDADGILNWDELMQAWQFPFS